MTLLLVPAALMLPSNAAACSCLPQGPPCEEYWRADAVFLGRVESIAREGEKKSGPVARSTRRVTFTVVEAFKGVSTGQVDVWTMVGGAACGYPFKDGAEYLVYAYRNAEAGEFRTGTCTRTRPSADADSDLDYARGLEARARPSGRITGHVRLDFQAPQAGSRSTPRPLSGLEVTLEKDGRQVRAVTDSGGVFEVDGLTAGKYRLSIDLPSGYYTEPRQPVVELPDDRACARVTAPVYHDGRVAGRVVDGAGREYRVFAERRRSGGGGERTDSTDQSSLRFTRHRDLPDPSPRTRCSVSTCRTLSSLKESRMRIRRGLSSKSLPCGCLAGVYETYDGGIVTIIDAQGPSCTDRAHASGNLLPAQSSTVRAPDGNAPTDS